VFSLTLRERVVIIQEALEIAENPSDARKIELRELALDDLRY